MKLKTKYPNSSIFLFVLLFSVGIAACKKDDKVTPVDNTTSVSETEKQALLKMLEEEKLARDTYKHLYSIWNVKVFDNISQSEQTHMNTVEDLLKQFGIEYTIEDPGVFANEELRNYYESFVDQGDDSLVQALKIGATIEDLDIVDLRDYLKWVTNSSIQSAFTKLQCGSRNHIRSFVSQLQSNNSDYTPQFLSVAEYEEILAGSHESCN